MTEPLVMALGLMAIIIVILIINQVRFIRAFRRRDKEE